MIHGTQLPCVMVKTALVNDNGDKCCFIYIFYIYLVIIFLLLVEIEKVQPYSGISSKEKCGNELDH